MGGGATAMAASRHQIGSTTTPDPNAISSSVRYRYRLWGFDHHNVDRHDDGDQHQRDQGLGEHYMNPRITAPQNRNARAAMANASFSKET
jgi:hypothetical protein